MKTIDVLCTRKQFLIGSGAAAVGIFCGRGLLQAQPGTSPSALAASTTPESADYVPDFPEHHPQFDRARVKRFVICRARKSRGGKSNAGRRTKSD